MTAISQELTVAPLPKLLLVLVLTAVACALAGCAMQVTGTGQMAPVTVSLNSQTVVVPQDGTPVHVGITIQSTSETALVSLVGLPGGVQEMYAATDTNPSGLLTFTATRAAMSGTYMPTVVVNSAGQMASLKFTLVVGSGKSMAEP
jgi:hypothetical protein